MLKSDYLTLLYIAMITYPTIVSHIHTVFILLGNDIDDSGNRIRTIEGRRSSFDDFDPFDVGCINDTQIILPTNISGHTFPVNQNQNIVIPQSVHLNAAAHITGIEGY